jgi:flagellar biosynthesis protein FlhG
MSIAVPDGMARRGRIVNRRGEETMATARSGWKPLALVPASGPAVDPILSPGTRDNCFSIAVVSGKGGVGKSSLVANLAVAMAEMGQRVLVLDGDWGLANVETLLGLVAPRSLRDVLSGRCRVEEIVLTGPAGIRVVPGGSGVEGLATLDDYRRESLLRALHGIARRDEVLLIDTGSGLHRPSLRLAQDADEILVVATPEPTALAGAGATLRALAGCRLARAPRLVVNLARSAEEAHRAARRIQRTDRIDCGATPELIGFIPVDETVRRAVMEQRPFVQIDPDAPASRGVRALARRLLARAPSPDAPAVTWGDETAPVARLRAA